MNPAVPPLLHSVRGPRSSLGGSAPPAQARPVGRTAPRQRPRAAAARRSFKAAACLAHAKTSYGGGEQTAATQRKLCFNVIRD